VAVAATVDAIVEVAVLLALQLRVVSVVPERMLHRHRTVCGSLGRQRWWYQMQWWRRTRNQKVMVDVAETEIEIEGVGQRLRLTLA